MIRIPTALAAVVAAAVLAPAAAAQVLPPPPPAPTPAPAVPVPPPAVPTIAPGVFAGRVPVGGLTIAQAADLLTRQVTRPAMVRVAVEAGGRRYTLRMRRIRMRFDALRSARRAFAAGVTRGPGAQVRLALRWDRRRVGAFVRRVDKRATIAPRDATLRITVRRLIRRNPKSGRALDEKALRVAIGAALAEPALPRLFRPGRTVVRARIQKKDLARQYGTVLTVDRSTYTLRLFKRLKLAKRYPIAVGAAGYDTPPGLYAIQNKQVNPAWYVPNRPWAGALAGTVVPGGAPNNPLKARWLGIVNGVGIHGTSEAWSIGSRASHGCIRMHVSDVIDLYPRVPVGAPVLIK